MASRHNRSLTLVRDLTPDELTVQQFTQKVTMLCDEWQAVPFDKDLRANVLQLLLHDAEEAEEALARINRRGNIAKSV